MPPLCVTVCEAEAVHESEIPELPPLVSHPCFWLVEVCTLIPVLLKFFVTLSSANTMRPLPIATVLTTNTAAIADIAINAVAALWFLMLVIL